MFSRMQEKSLLFEVGNMDLIHHELGVRLLLVIVRFVVVVVRMC